MLELHQFEGCPYCQIVRQELDELGLDYVVRTTPRAHPERTRLQEISGQSGVPVLVDTERGEVVTESQGIIDYLHRHYAAEAGSR